MTKTIETREFDSEQHSERLKELAASLARAVNLDEDGINDLLLLAKCHDVGKAGPLTEQKTMKLTVVA